VKFLSHESGCLPGRFASLVALATAVYLLVPTRARADERQTLHGHVPADVAHLKVVERLPASRRLQLSITLALRDPQSLDELLGQISDPASPNYGKSLTPAQITEKFAPSEKDYQSVIDFAKAHGLTITGRHSNRVILDVQGSVSDIEKALHVTLGIYKHPREARNFYAPDAEPWLDLAVPVARIAGLDDFASRITPVITSGTAVTATQGREFSYQITASGGPASYEATDLPPGLALDSLNGLISGVPTTRSTSTVVLSAGNAGGTGTAMLRLTVQPLYYWSNIACSPGDAGTIDGTGTGAEFRSPTSAKPDTTGGIVYVAEPDAGTIRKMAPSATGWAVTTIAGTAGVTGTADGPGNKALFNSPGDVIADSKGNLYVADLKNQTIRKMTPSGTNWVATTLAGIPGVSGTADGTGQEAQFNAPGALAMDGDDTIYMSDIANLTVRKLTLSGTGCTVATIAGRAGQSGSTDGSGSEARFAQPEGVVVDGHGNVYVVDSWNFTVRKLTFSGTTWTVTTIAGSPLQAGSADGPGRIARFNSPAGLALDGNGTLYVSDCVNHTVRRLTLSGTDWMVDTIGGSAGQTGTQDGLGSAARFSFPQGVAADNAGNLYVADWRNQRISMGTPAPFITSPSAATAAYGTPFSYQIISAGNPTSYNATGLPPGLNVNTASGLITGTPATSGTSHVTISANNIAGIGSAPLVITVPQPPPPPAIIMRPAAQTVTAGKPAGFTVNATGSRPFIFQWYKNGIPIPGAINSSSTLPAASTRDAGDYTVTVTDSYGFTTSGTCNLVVNPPKPSIPIWPIAALALLFSLVGISFARMKLSKH